MKNRTQARRKPSHPPLAGQSLTRTTSAEPTGRFLIRIALTVENWRAINLASELDEREQAIAAIRAAVPSALLPLIERVKEFNLVFKYGFEPTKQELQFLVRLGALEIALYEAQCDMKAVSEAFTFTPLRLTAPGGLGKGAN